MTKTKIKNLSSTKRKLTITVPSDEVQKYFTKALQKVGQNAKLPGFRKGKIPNEVLQRHYGAEINFECLNFLVSDTYPKVMQEEKLIPLMEPQFATNPITHDKDYTYDVEIEVKPDFKLKDYKNIKIKKKEAKITDEELNVELNRLQESLAQLAPAKDDDKLQTGFVATIDFDGKLDGKSFKGGTAKDYTFEYGVGQLLKDFENGIKDMKKGEKRKIEITFPDDYFEKSLASKKVSYDIELKSLHVKNIPNLDDELAKDIGKENLDQVKNELKESLIKRKEREFRNDYSEDIKQNLLKSYKIDVPEDLVNKEAERTQRNKDEIRDQLKLELILETIAEEEKIQASNQDIEQRLAMLSQVYRQPVHEIRNLYTQNNMLGMLATQIVLDKTIDFIIDNAKMV